MPKAKIALTLDRDALERLDGLVSQGMFANRSCAVEVAVREKLDRLDRIRLARECARLDRGAERDLAEEGLSADAGAWPEY
ncbi:MAG: CopG family transcriptional regulator [Gemmatimonadetes bacterium RBG_16_66_8]|nr:MAG: CopG family transcriptional regulator [Gemmatimonadetes bacterium RBG_16_66_8]